MPFKDDENPSPSQVFEQQRNNLEHLFKEKAKLPDKISRYQITEELGKGGMGCVYKAYDPQMEQFIALKVILSGEKAQKKEIQRFVQEAKAMAKMNHPNIVRVYDIGEDNDHPFITMDYIEGQSLKEYLQKTSLKIRPFCQLMAKIGKAIAYAHNEGIIHRDLKPENILINKKLEPQVMDFGLAKLAKVDNSLSKKGSIVGTPRYMSPEQAKGEKVNNLTDVYALGAIFYEMLLGKVLIQGQTVSEIIYKVINQEPKLLREINNKLSIDLETICSKAVEKEATKRYQSASEFVEDIERFVNGELIKARPASFLEKTWKKIKKNKANILACVIGISLLVLGILFFSRYQNKTNTKLLIKYLSLAKEMEKDIVPNASLIAKKKAYITIKNYLEKALSISNNNKVRKKYYKVQKKLEALLKEQTNLKEKNINYISKVMKKVAKDKSIETNQMQWYITQITHTKGKYIVKHLLSFLKSPNRMQRKIAIQALGKIGDTYTRVNGKDTVQHLLELLSKIDPKNNSNEAYDIIWALGWLGDHRANAVVEQKRWQMQENNIFWRNTTFAYSLLPDAKITKVISQEKLDFKKLNQEGIMRIEKKDFLGAIKKFNKAIAIKPNYAQPYNNRGKVYLEFKNLKKALADFNMAIKLDNKQGEVYINRSNLRLGMGDLSGALKDLNSAIEISPKNDLAYANRGLVYIRLQQYDKAIADCSKSISINPVPLSAYLNRGLAYGRVKRFANTLKDYNHVIKMDPNFTNAYYYRAFVYLHFQEKTKALADFSKTIKLNPRHVGAHFHRAKMLLRAKNFQEALAGCSVAIKLDPTHIEAYYYRAATYMQTKNIHAALADYNIIIKLKPEHKDSYYRRGYCWELLKQGKKAVKDYTQAIKIKPSYAKAYISRGYALLRLGARNYAIKDFRKFIKLEPSSPHCKKLLVYIKKYGK